MNIDTAKDFETIEDILKRSRYELCWPVDKSDLLLDYPELDKIPQIKALEGKPNDLLFVWFYAYRASPIMRVHGAQARITGALRAVYGDPVPLPYSNWREDTLPQHIAEAAAAMKRLELGARTRERLMCERNILNAQQIIDIDVKTELKDLEWSQKKAYLESVQKSMDIVHQARTIIEGLSGVVKLEHDQEPEGHKRAQLNRMHVEPL